MRTDREKLILKEKNIYKAFFILALPVMGAEFLKALHDMVDTYFVGHMQGSVAAQAGMGIAWPVLNILLSFNIGLSVAGVALISQFIGAGEKQEAKRYAGLLFLSSIVLGIAINGALFFAAPAILRFMGAKEEVFDCALAYLRIRSFEMVFVFLFTAFQAFRQAQGDMVAPMLLSVLGVTVNIVLTGLFIRGFGMGIAGAAYATVIGQAVAALFALRGFFRTKSRMCLKAEELRCDKKRMYRLFKIAAPSAGSQALSSFGFLILQAVILDYGKEVSAAFGIGNKISNMLLIVVVALGTVLAAFVGQNIGAENKERAKKSYFVSRNAALAVTALGVIVLFPLRRHLAGLLSNDALTVEVSMEYIFWVLATQPMLALFQNYLGVFNGSGNTRLALWLSISRLWFMRLPMILVFKICTDFGRQGVWYTMAASNVLIVVLGHFLLKKVDYEPKINSRPS